jgi:hypothetical protein
VLAVLPALAALSACRREAPFSLAGSWVDERTRGRDAFLRYEAGGAVVTAKPATGYSSRGTYTIEPVRGRDREFLVLTARTRDGVPVVDSVLLRVVDSAHVRVGDFVHGRRPDLDKGGAALVRVTDAEGARIEEGTRQVALEKLRRRMHGGW